MTDLRKLSSLCLLLCLALALATPAAHALIPLYSDHVTVSEEGKGPSITLDVARGGFYTILLLSEKTGKLYTIATNFHLYPQKNVVPWDGRAIDGTQLPVGDYELTVYMDDPSAKSAGDEATAPPDVAVETALVFDLKQSTDTVTGAGIWCDLQASKPGTLETWIIDRQQGGAETAMLSLTMGAGPMRFNWDATIDGERVPPGDYSIGLSFTADDGETFSHVFDFSVASVSPAYSSLPGHSYWSMAPGEPDDAAIWDILTQPITVFDNGHIGASGHTYLMENPDGTGKRVAQIHGLSQGLHLIGMENEHGYILVEAFSNYDPVFQPSRWDAEAQATARELKQGYIEAKHLKRVDVDQTIGLVVDKLSQRMYVFINGKRVTELIVSTGFPGTGNARMYRETIPGEFITISYPGGFFSDEIFSDLGIRYNGGSLLHEVPCIFDDKGKRQYAQFERLLGRKASAGCVRIQRELNPDGFNHRKLFYLLRSDAMVQPSYKIIIWDDLGRTDSPDVWYEAPADRIDKKEEVVVPELPV